MADQIIEFTLPPGDTLSVVLTPVDDIETEYTADDVTELRPGWYAAIFEDQAIPSGMYRIEATSGESLAGRGLVNITAAAGTFRETIEATATVDTESIVTAVVDGIGEEGVSISGFQPAAITQLKSADVGLSQWDPETEPANIYRGMDHLHATGNDFVFTNAEGTWPDLTGCTVRMELRIAHVTAVAGTGIVVVASGEGQQVYVQVLRTAFDSSDIKDGTGTFRVVRIDAQGSRFPLANGIVTLYPNTAPAA